MVSIGPYHYGNRRLEDMQKHKLRLLRQFLNRTKVHLDDCIRTMINLEQKVRNCYEAIDSNDFTEMMLLDACFILELFHLNRSRQPGCLESDPLFSARAFIPCIRRDLLMLENQIPLFVLESLFKLVNDKENVTCPKKNDKETVTSLALDFFNPAIEKVEIKNDVKPLTCCSMCLPSGSHRDRGVNGNEVNNRNDGGIQGNNSNSTKQLHLLHIILQSLLPSNDKTGKPKTTRAPQIPNDSHRPHSMMHCVSVLRDHGIKFAQKCNSTRIMDITFEGGHLQIPQLVINDSTRSIFLNLMAFEQCYSQCGNHVTSYVNFMDGLINRPKDVSYLHRQKIIVHRLGSEEAVARLFNQLCREMAFDTDDNGNLSLVSKGIDEFIQKRRHTWWASLKHEYLRHPWAIISICAATFLLGLTVVGTLYAILSFQIHRS